MEPTLGWVCDFRDVHLSCLSSKGTETKTKGRTEKENSTPDHSTCQHKGSYGSSTKTRCEKKKAEAKCLPSILPQDPQDPFLAESQDRIEHADDFDLYVTYDSAF